MFSLSLSLYIQAEMSSLLCQFSVVGADAAHIKRLEVALRQAQSEKESLVTKLHKLEKQQVCVLIFTTGLCPNFLPLFLEKEIRWILSKMTLKN